MAEASRPEESPTAAADLFGSADDASADLFSFTESDAPAADDPFAPSVDAGHSAHGLFGDASYPNVDDYAEVVNSSAEGETPLEGADQAHSSEGTAWDDKATTDYSQQGYYDQNGEWQWYDTQGTTDTTGWTGDQMNGTTDAAAYDQTQYQQYETQQSDPYSQYAPPQVDTTQYAPSQPSYAPQPSSTPAYQPTNPTIPSYAPAAPYAPAPSTYAPPPLPSTQAYMPPTPSAPSKPSYTPSSRAVSYAAPPPADAASSSVYDPYKPQGSHPLKPAPPRPRHTRERSSSSYGYGVYDQPAPPKKAPARPSMSSVKSSLVTRQPSNAYDPPMPTRRATQTRSAYGSPGFDPPSPFSPSYASSQAPLSPPPALSPPPSLPPPPRGPSRGPSRDPPTAPPPPALPHPPSQQTTYSPEGFSYYTDPPPFIPSDNATVEPAYSEETGGYEYGSDPYPVHSEEQAPFEVGHQPDGEPNPWEHDGVGVRADLAEEEVQPLTSHEEGGYAKEQAGETTSGLPKSRLEDSMPAWMSNASAVREPLDAEDPYRGFHADDTAPSTDSVEPESAPLPASPEPIADASASYGFDDNPFDNEGGEASQPLENGDALGYSEYRPVEEERPTHIEPPEVPKWHPAYANPEWRAKHYEPPLADYNQEPWLTGAEPAAQQQDADSVGTRHDDAGVFELPQFPKTPVMQSETTMHDPYAPPSRMPGPPATGPPMVGRARSTSQVSTPPSLPMMADNSSPYGNSPYVSRYQYNGTVTPDPYAPPSDPVQPASYPLPSIYEAPAELAPALPAYEPYEPGVGTDDPLDRASCRAPMISFAFGGKVLSCFPSTTASVPGLPTAESRTVHIRPLHVVVPSSAVETSASPFPGPVFLDPAAGSIGAGFVRGVAGSTSKTKKAAVLKYLEDRAAEIEGGLAYLSLDDEHAGERRSAEGKLVIVKLLHALVEHDGKLSGSTAIENSVRQALVPHVGSVALPATELAATTASPGIFGMSYVSGKGGPAAASEGLRSPFMPSGPFVSAEPMDAPISVYEVRPSALDKIQEFLLRGERRKAVHYALDEKMWAHALVISSSIDKEAWKEAVSEFIRFELGSNLDHADHDGRHERTTSSNGRESLRIAYSLFAGNGAASVQELLPPKLLMKGGGSTNLLATPMPAIHVTPMSPNFPQPALTSNIPVESLSKWREAAATLLSNQATGNSQALTALGDYLISNRWVEAAHACYLLSPLTSPLGAAGAPSVRMVLLGSENPSKVPSVYRDVDGIQLSEILEFAFSLAPPLKGQENSNGLPYLQPYRLLRAYHLAEMGHVTIATRYCDSISQVVKQSGGRASSIYSPTFLAQLKEFTDRLKLVPHEDKLGFWSAKVPKPTLDGFGTWLGGGISKFIAGDAESPATAAEEDDASREPQAHVGPFSHYSAISSAVPSNAPSPHSSSTNLLLASTSPPQRRAGSAMGTRSVPQPFPLIDRAASAMDRPMVRSHSPAVPAPRTYSADAATTSFQQVDPNFAYGTHNLQRNETSASDEGQEVQVPTTWWGGLDEERTPTAVNFVPVAANGTDANGFISLMDTDDPTPMRSPHTARPLDEPAVEDDEEDLGFGNRNSRRPAGTDTQKFGQDASAEQKKEEAAPARKIEHKPSSSGWFRGWFTATKKEGAESPAGAPVRANLGEENAFYYDKDLKRWVNKKAGAAGEDPKPVTPPPRAQTASPGRSARLQSETGPISAPISPAAGGGFPGSRPPPPGSVGGPPRSMSAVPPRRSNLADSFTPVSEGDESGTSTPSVGLGPSRPPGGSVRAAGSKRNVRSRYVDVFKEGNTQ